ncbi:hypothetical protein [Duganella aceris]|jgi:hypothetical protein|uniref:Uncharacterized protein n=1 Tax=Duganella aceris TaxID=2703883 RepID=A0ABX0FL98_9BURK|nr:hypothetical protein [Duganella aceris]NGZ85283.1 hypothetical protein [Duganella aceris]
MDENKRKNTLLSSAVEHGIWLSMSQGSAVAWAYMQAYHVPLDAIRRVLAYPEARRQRPVEFMR